MHAHYSLINLSFDATFCEQLAALNKQNTLAALSSCQHRNLQRRLIDIVDEKNNIVVDLRV